LYYELRDGEALGMASIGETLRRERQRRNINLEQVSRELKISSRFLQAIEEENFELLPAGVFAKSFVRQYARMLGLDEDEAAKEVQRALAPAVPQFAAGANLTTPAAEKKAPPLPQYYIPKVEAWQHVRDRSSSRSSPLAALGLVVVAMLGCSLIYGWWQRQRHPATVAAAPVSNRQQPAPPPRNVPEPQPATAAPQEVSTSAGPPAAASAASATAPSAAASAAAPSAAASASETPAASGGGVAVKVEVTAAEPVWVSARSDGKYLFSGTLKANETRTVEASSTVVLRLGNAGGVTITLNGKPIGEVGPKGQVRTVQLTSGGFQIVAPKPSAPAAVLI
jgi:cytoskeleton protein RodZ